MSYNELECIRNGLSTPDHAEILLIALHGIWGLLRIRSLAAPHDLKKDNEEDQKARISGPQGMAFNAQSLFYGKFIF